MRNNKVTKDDNKEVPPAADTSEQPLSRLPKSKTDAAVVTLNRVVTTDGTIAPNTMNVQPTSPSKAGGSTKGAGQQKSSAQEAHKQATLTPEPESTPTEAEGRVLRSRKETKGGPKKNQGQAKAPKKRGADEDGKGEPEPKKKNTGRKKQADDPVPKKIAEDEDTSVEPAGDNHKTPSGVRTASKKGKGTGKNHPPSTDKNKPTEDAEDLLNLSMEFKDSQDTPLQHAKGSREEKQATSAVSIRVEMQKFGAARKAERQRMIAANLGLTPPEEGHSSTSNPPPPPARIEKIDPQIWNTVRGKEKKMLAKMIAENQAYVGDARGCFELTEQVKLDDVISKGRATIPPAGNVHDLLVAVAKVTPSHLVTVTYRNAVGDIVAANRAANITWALPGMLRRLESKRQTDIKTEERVIIATPVAKTVEPLSVITRGVVGEKTSRLVPQSMKGQKTLASAATTFGAPKAHSEKWSFLTLNDEGLHNTTNVEYLYLASFIAALDLMYALEYPNFFGAPTFKQAHNNRPIERNINWDDFCNNFQQPGFTDDQRDFIAMGRTHLPITHIEEMYWAGVIDLLRDDQAVTRFTEVPAGDAFIRKTCNITLEGVNFWMSFARNLVPPQPGTIPGALTSARTEAAANPSLIFGGAAIFARKTGTLDQLNSALARAISMVCGVLIPLQPGGNSDFVLMTAFVEAGTIVAPTVHCIPLYYPLSQLKESAMGGSLAERAAANNTTSAEERSTPVAETASKREDEISKSVGAMLSLISNHLTGGYDFITSVTAAGSATFAASALVANTVGLDWSHFRRAHGHNGPTQDMRQYEEWLQNEAGVADSEPSPFARAVHATMLHLFNCSWPKGALIPPRATGDIGIAVRDVARMGPPAGEQFGHTEHMVGWLEYVLGIPDAFAITRGSASGNLSITIQKEEATSGQYDWSLRRFYTGEDWLQMCTEPDTATDRRLINEANLVIYIIVRAMRLDLCRENGFEYSALTLEVDGTFDVDAYDNGAGPKPDWWATHCNFLNGDAVIDAMKWECVKATPRGTALEPMFTQLQPDLPGNLSWEWDPILNGINPDSDRHTQTNEGRHEIWLPWLYINEFPQCVGRALSVWSDNALGSTHSVTMHPADWPHVVSSNIVPQRFASAVNEKRWQGDRRKAAPVTRSMTKDTNDQQ